MSSPAAANAVPELVRENPAKIVTAEACGECHASAFEVWKKTPHATGFKELHRLENAEEIAGRMGFRLIKRDSSCLNCHYTSVIRKDQIRAVSGVSCESCHGAGRDWINIHNDYGGQGVKHATETAEHRQQRVEASRAQGMRRPSDLVEVADACFGCHTVPDEQLVNVGKHSIGSAGFELVEWSQGTMRHNFLDSFRGGEQIVNVERPQSYLRRMFVVGRVLELEHAFRGVARATEPGVFLKALQRRARNATREVRAIEGRIDDPSIAEIMTIARAAKVQLGQGPALEKAADEIHAAIVEFAETHDGTRLAALDAVIDGTAEPLEDPFGQESTALAAAPSAADDSGQGASPGGSAESPGSVTDASRSAGSSGSPGVPAEGETRRFIRPRSSHDTLDATTCQKCHGEQNSWWFGDPHYAAIEPFFEQRPENLKIARLYGLSASAITRGDSLCMDCHATVVTGRERREAADGVSCQSCHGPAGDYLKPHQEGDKALGAERPGYVRALQIGMQALLDLETRAKVCTGCHYITDRRLLSSGHPSGATFDYEAGMRKIRHWQDPPESEPGLGAAIRSVLDGRGDVPQVRLAKLPSSGSAASSRATEAPSVAAIQRTGRAVSPGQPATPRARPAARTSREVGSPTPGTTDDLNVPDWPEIDTNTPIEEILEQVQERLRLLYELVGGESRP